MMKHFVKENGMVIAVMENTKDDVFDFLLANYPDCLHNLYEENLENYKLKNKYVGIAKCSPEDNFDLEYGMLLSSTRAKMKHDKAMSKIVEKILSEEANKLERAREKMLNKLRNTTTKYTTLIGEEESNSNE